MNWVLGTGLNPIVIKNASLLPTTVIIDLNSFYDNSHSKYSAPVMVTYVQRKQTRTMKLNPGSSIKIILFPNKEATIATISPVLPGHNTWSSGTYTISTL